VAGGQAESEVSRSRTQVAAGGGIRVDIGPRAALRDRWILAELLLLNIFVDN
jgi:hypothetical protein